MSETNVRRDSDFLTRVGSRITVWVLGTGLLSLHATVFTLTIIGMVFWNIYDSPTDLWVGDLIRRWGVLLLFHAVAVIAGWTAWRLLRAEQRAINQSRTDWIAPQEPAFTPVLANTWQPPIAFQPVPATRTASPIQKAGISIRQFFAYSALLTTRLGRAVGSAFHSPGAIISGRKNRENQATDSPPQDQSRAWPEGPIRVQGEESDFMPRFAGADGQASSNGRSFDQAQTGASATHPTGITPAGGSEVTVPSVGKDASQTWVEAATTGWLTPREDEPPADATALNGNHSPKADAARAPDDEQS